MKTQIKKSTIKATEGLSSVAMKAKHGRLVSSRFFKKHLVATVFIVGLIMMYISNRYDCVTGMESINKLQLELDLARTDLQNQKSTYMSSIRESSMKTLVDTLHMGLEIQQRPPYKITLSQNGN